MIPWWLLNAGVDNLASTASAGTDTYNATTPHDAHVPAINDEPDRCEHRETERYGWRTNAGVAIVETRCVDCGRTLTDSHETEHRPDGRTHA